MKYIKLYESFDFEEVWEEEPEKIIEVDLTGVQLGENGPKFKVLDKVVWVSRNKVGYIIDYDILSNCYLIYFIDKVGGVAGKYLNIPDGYSYFIPSNFIKKVSDL